MSKSSRPVVIAGNWKMYKTIDESVTFVQTLAPLVEKSQAAIYLAVPFTAIRSTVLAVNQLKASVKIGAQNMHDASDGAFTGEIAARMLTDVGAQFVILGHSERRHLFQESNAFINKKVKRALKAKLQPIVCIGETLEQRESGQTEEVLKSQLLESLKGVSIKAMGSVILAYEPVWAIGTGKVAHPHDAEAVHHFCRSIVEEKWGEKVAANLVIQYGGSVKPENAAELIAQANIDGLLVGGSSLVPETFGQIINTYQGMSA